MASDRLKSLITGKDEVEAALALWEDYSRIDGGDPRSRAAFLAGVASGALIAGNENIGDEVRRFLGIDAPQSWTRLPSWLETLNPWAITPEDPKP